MSLLENLKWRFSVRKFDPSKKVSAEDEEKILEAIRLAPSSFGFQPFRILIVEDAALREKLSAFAPVNQQKIMNSSFLLVFCADTDTIRRIDAFIDLASEGDKGKKKEAEARWERIKQSFAAKSKDETIAWAARQTYIALGFGLAACADLHIDSCPMEGFDKEKFKEILALPDNLYPQVLLAVGYRAADEIEPAKIRFSKEDLFENR